MTAKERNKAIRALFDKDMELCSAKGHDYAGEEDALANLRKWGVLGITVRLGDKMSRLERFAKSGRLKVTEESVEDIFRDMSIYCYLARLLLREKQGKEPRPEVGWVTWWTDNAK